MLTNVNDMIAHFKLIWNKEGNLAAPAYTNTEIVSILNEEQARFIKEKAFGTKLHPVAFEGNQKRVSELEPIIVTDIISTAANFTDATTMWGNCYYFPLTVAANRLTQNFLYYISSRSQITRTEPTITAGWVDNKYIKHEFINKFAPTSFNSSVWFKEPVCWMELGRLYIMFDSYTTGYMNDSHNVLLTYIRQPTVLAAAGNCDLPSEAMYDIVEMAVKSAMETQGDARYEAKLIEEQKQE